MVMTDEEYLPALAQARALEGRVRVLTAERDDANRDRARLTRENTELSRQLAEVSEQLRNERADRALRAIAEAQASGVPVKRPKSRPLTDIEQVLATLVALGVIAAPAGFLLSAVALGIGGLAVAGLSWAAFAVCRTSPNPEQPFSLVDRGKWSR
jgi:hypothetical protein